MAHKMVYMRLGMYYSEKKNCTSSTSTGDEPIADNFAALLTLLRGADPSLVSTPIEVRLILSSSDLNMVSSPFPLKVTTNQ